MRVYPAECSIALWSSFMPYAPPPQLLANIDEDLNCIAGLKPQLKTSLLTASDEAQAKNKFSQFCQEHATLHPGPSIQGLAPGEGLGSIRHFVGFTRWLAKVTANTPSNIENLLNRLTGTPVSLIDQTRALKTFQTRIVDRGIPVGEGTCWLYRNPASPNRIAFSGLGPNCLPWQLALPSAQSGQKYIMLSIETQKAGPYRRPTILDTTYDGNEYWRPGGKTVPRTDSPLICASAGMAGLEEVLSPSPSFSALNDPLRAIIAS
jgi:hypothetical protein